MIGICIYVGTRSGVRALGVSDYVALLTSAMGFQLTEEELMIHAKRSRNLEKAFDTLHTGMSRKDDLPPHRYIEEPVKTGLYRGHVCEMDKWVKILDEFYVLQGWDKRTGLQTREMLNALDMEDVAERLEKAGKLIG